MAFSVPNQSNPRLVAANRARAELDRRKALNNSSFLSNFAGFRDILGDLLNQRLAGSLSAAAGRQGTRPGAEGFDVSGIVGNMSLTSGFDLASELQDIRGQLSGLAESVGKGPSASADALAGAAAGFATGGPIGAAAGFVGGGLSGRGARKASGKTKKRIAEAQELASPEGFARTAAEVGGAARERALASGEGQTRAQDIESAITASGLRGTGLGTLASIAAGGQVELAGLEQILKTTLDETSRRIESIVGAPVQGGDPLARALGGLADAFLTYRSQPGNSPANPLLAQRVNEGFDTPPLIPGYGASDYDAPTILRSPNVGP